MRTDFQLREEGYEIDDGRRNRPSAPEEGTNSPVWVTKVPMGYPAWIWRLEWFKLSGFGLFS